MSEELIFVLGAVLAVGAIGYLFRGTVLGAMGIKLTPSQISAFASAAGFSGDDLTKAVAIALAESAGDPSAIGDKALAPTRGPSIGLWQINVGTDANPQYSVVDLTDPQNNANAAYSLYSARGGSFEDWATFDPRDGSTPRYLAFINDASAATGFLVSA